jgi:hypothetical protein
VTIVRIVLALGIAGMSVGLVRSEAAGAGISADERPTSDKVSGSLPNNR